MKRFYNCLRLYMLLLFVISCQFEVYSQKNMSYDTEIIDSLISNKEFKKADALLINNINELKQEKAFLELTKRIYYVGKIAAELENEAIAIKKANDFANSITDLTDSLSVLRQKHLVLSRFYVYLHDYKKSSEQNLLALEITKKIPDATGDLFGIIHHNLGVDYRRLGNIKASTYHSRMSLKHYLSYTKSDKTKILDAYNSLGGRMWDAYKIDSALFYFKKGEEIIAKLDPTPMNQHYHAASNQANIASVQATLGNTKESLKYNERAIKNYFQFLKSTTQGKDFFKEEARKFLYISIENYAGDYSKQGNLQKAKELNTYALEEKKKYLDRDDPELAYSYLQVANSHLKLKDFKTAEKFINKSLDIYTNQEQKDYLGIADGYYYKGTVNEYYGNIESAKECYEKSKGYYESVFGDSYDGFYLSAMITLSEFYAKNGYTDKAIEMATTIYNYVVNNQGESTVLEYSLLVNLARIQYRCKNYSEASKQINKALALLSDSYATEVNELNFLEKPKALMLKSEIELKLTKDKDSLFLKNQFKSLKEAITILEQQKTMAIEDQNISIILADNDQVFELAKAIAMMLYEETNDKKYLNEILSIHESKLYNKIRQQLNVQSDFILDNIPKSILEAEKLLKKEFNSTLNMEGGLETFFETNKNWSDLLETLKRDYPKYYNLKYASISQSLNLSTSNFPDNKSIVRYVIIQEKLYAFIIEKNKIESYLLDMDKLKHELDSNENADNLQDDNLNFYSNLYDILWKPFENSITNQSVIVVPDGELFNLSFEVLTTTKVKSFKELSKKSLLSKYNISYNYSLLLIDKNKSPKFFENNFVAFTPEFTDQMKNNYKVAIKDSVLLDKTYLKLLPQPFTVDLAKEYSQLFSGNSFTNERASKQVFSEQAKEHKIIHIGTHAESNNVSPEFSRLIFAKNLDDNQNTDNNSLYTYEIYNQNLASNLAILTACETGKPTFQPGEGMISLAHAFNYAGSESILTSLWKIDEQSSATIIENFYGYLKEGLPKDEALQKAKLDYIATAEGRTISPQYWAGLVLIGDAAPIDLDSTNFWWIWTLLTVTIILALVLYIRNKKASNPI
ncbi:CHAT domain-containing protein [Winogradskyella forsetii]|uniref:CHAT domain-containing protein n=1 Tax=Winogradskyella forsetii TaxID=2686077 RepID=UPI0015C0A2D6|nr:CHAT domain-containing tetratricopeptide repeat protein [Winogradskyella forsetii]